MFSCDWSEWPLVTLRFSEAFRVEDETLYLDSIQRLADAREPYAVILVTQGDEHLSQKAKVRNNMIFKHNRDHFTRYCRQFYRVKTDVDWAEIDDTKLKKAMPFPAAHAPSEEVARRLALAVLAAAR
ncbi:hypothetical protein [Dongia sp.]|uniref:hypothetical protein n=1 Tax=Dongia sp. TaxID=1977262 RepID=UPI0035B290D4